MDPNDPPPAAAPRRAKRIPTRLLSLGLALAACSTPRPGPHPDPLPRLPDRAPPPAQVLRVEEGRPISGSVLGARPGDFLLENRQVAAVVTGLDGDAPGALCDAADAGRRRDALRFLRPLAGQVLRAPRLERVQAEELGGVATLRLEGHDPTTPELAVVIEYGLGPGRREIQIVTTVSNRGSSPLLGVLLGDSLDLGAADPFVPGSGHGIAPSSASQPSSAPAAALEWPWLGAWNDEVSYLYRARVGPLRVRPLPLTLESTLASVDLAPGASASATRWVSIGAGGGLQGIALSVAGQPRGRLETTVLGDGEPLPAGRVEIWRGGGLHAEGRGDRDGNLSFDLEPGSYLLRALAPGRAGIQKPARVDADRVAAVRLEAGPASALVHDLRDERGGELPVVIAVEGDRAPWRGARATEAGSPPRTLVVSVTGRGTLPLPPGRYRVLADHGPLHTIQSEELSLVPRGGASFSGRLRRVVVLDPPLTALDLGQQSLASPGCAAPAEERMNASLASGLEAVVVGEWRRLASWPRPRAGRPLLLGGVRLAGGSRWPAAIGSTDPVEAAHGAILLYPLAADHQLETALAGHAEEIPSRVVELEEEHTGEALGAADPTRLPTLTAQRLIDHHPASFEARFARWLSLLRAGRKLVATGGSSGCGLTRPGGFPRSYLDLEGAPPSATSIAAAIRGGRVLASNGPVLRLTVEGKGPGATVPARIARPARGAGRPRSGVVTARVQVLAPAWIALDEVQLYLDGKPWGRSFAIPGRADGVRLDQTVEIPIQRAGSLLAVVRGPPGGMSPVAPEARPLALVNPIWITLGSTRAAR